MDNGFKMCPYCTKNNNCNIKDGFKQYLKNFFPKANSIQITTVSSFIAEACPEYFKGD
jgi:hypothetical protein